MNFDEYQKLSSSTADYPGKGTIIGLSYVSLGLAGEAGEVSNKIKKVIRDDALIVTEDKREQVRRELGDVLWYAAGLCTELGLSLQDVATYNLKILADRQKRGVLHGEGDRR